MNILLINNNPVVSRLFDLCTREEHRILEEVSSVKTIQHGSYDVVFVDEGVYEREIVNLSDILAIGKKVLLSNTDVDINDFDMTIKKPFLPSQIMEVLENIEETDEIKLSDTQVLDAKELEKIKALLNMDEEIGEHEVVLSEEEIELRKVEAIKEQLIAEGLEIVGEEEIVNELSETDEIAIFFNKDNVEKASPKRKNKKKKSRKNTEKKKKKKSVDFNEEELERIEDAVQVAIAILKRKQMKKLLKGKEIEISIKLEGNN